MADPVTIAVMTGVSMAATAAGGALKASGQLQEGAATQEMYRYKAAIAEKNRQYESMAGEIEAQRRGMKSRFEVGQARATQGASNLDVYAGSAPLVRQSIHDVGVQEQAMARSEFGRRAYGYEAESLLDVAAGKQARKASKIAAFGTLLGTASSVSDKWLAGSQAGMKLYG